MAEASFDVEQIVREVMARLGGSSSSVPAAQPGELRLTERLITLETLDKRLSGVRRVAVAARAVVTPAARDRLRELGIAIDRDSPAAANAKQATTLIAWSDAGVDLSPLNQVLSADGIILKHCGCPDLPTAVGTISRAVTGSARLGVIVTSMMCAALCMANRKPGVQAILGYDPASVECAVRNIAANVLVLPSAAEPFAQKRLITTFCRTTPRAMHQQFQQHL